MRRTLASASVLAALLTAAGSASADLSTYGYGNARTGSDPAPAGITPKSVKRLRVAWQTRLDGAIDGQPVVLDGLRMGHGRRTVVLVGTGHGEVAALDGHSGKVLWEHRLASRKIEPDCNANPDARFGVTATLVADRKAGRVYAVDVNGRAWALRLSNGTVIPGWPVRVHPKGADFDWGALTLAHGSLYVAIASVCDAGHYRGGITQVTIARPHTVRHWFSTAGTSAFGGSIWGWAGLSIDPISGDVYAATGNSLGAPNEATGNAEAVVMLSPTLHLLAANHPLEPPFLIGDRDFGTTPVLFQRRGCPPQLVAIDKDGELFLYDRATIDAGPVQRLRVAAQSPGSVPLYGVPVFDSATNTLILVSPTTPPASSLRAGIQAFNLTARCSLALRWQAAFDYPDAGSDGTVAGGVLYLSAGRNGWMRSFAAGDGRRLWSHHLSHAGIFAAPTVDRGTLYAAGWSGYVWALRPHRR